ncbi:hypothetical protein SAMN04487866_10140 [Thermoactinomyces sp. DSM 45891]|uniref:hypothetical protein n=1 Tax=Thermoactinomyces sp. DSM 45891 TaxID=1761907 RepID=UPI00091095A1|nr:hypothetical protein [Thermoactinomyces sp. DSM 45891]SFW98175.1 hypothetical protein SAMN04487866_10140 [Thermoactinomyces sp. DSM 45891]
MNQEDTKVDREGIPFNSAIDHYQKMEGLPNKSAYLSHIPKWLQIFWCSFMIIMIGGSLFLLYMSFVD